MLDADIENTYYIGYSMVDVGTAAAVDLPIVLVPRGYGIIEARQRDATLAVLKTFSHAALA